MRPTIPSSPTLSGFLPGSSNNKSATTDNPNSSPLTTLASSRPSSPKTFIQLQLLEGVTKSAKPLSDEIRQQIIHDVIHGFTSWEDSKSIQIRRYPFDLSKGHFVLALLMESLYERHCQANLKDENLPLEDDLDRLYHEVVHALLAQPLSVLDRLELEKMREHEFKPRMRQTFAILYEGFAKVPLLRQYAPEHRWRFLIDRIKIDILERHGFNSNNPLLAFIFDTVKDFALGLAAGWVESLSDSSIKQPFDLKRAYELQSIGTQGTLFHQGGMSFGGTCTPGGLLRMAESMKYFSELGFPTILKLRFRNRAYVQTSDKAYRFVGGVEEISFEKPFPTYFPFIQGTTKSVTELMEQDIQDEPPFQMFEFERHASASETKKTLETAIITLLEPVNNLLNEGSENAGAIGCCTLEARNIIAQTDLNEELLHAMHKGNYRLWALFAKNIWYAKLGEGVTLPYNPNVSFGSSCEEVVEIDMEGQEYCVFLKQQVKDDISADPLKFSNELEQRVKEGAFTAVKKMVTVAKLYPQYSPSASQVQKMINVAIGSGQSSQIKAALTELPNFSLYVDEHNKNSWLSIAAQEGDEEFCAHLLRMGACAAEIERHVIFTPPIANLLDAARTIQRYSKQIKPTGDGRLEGMFRALKSYDIKVIRQDMESWMPPLTSDTAPDHFVRSLMSQPHNAFAILVLAKEKLLSPVSEMSAEEFKTFLRLPVDKPLLLDLVRDKNSLGVDAFLAGMTEFALSDETRLEILAETDATGVGVLHQAAVSNNYEAINVVLDMVDRLDASPIEKLNFLFSKNKDGLIPLDWAADSKIARRILQSIAALPLPDRMKFEKLCALDENNESILDHLIETNNAEVAQLLLNFLENLKDGTVSDREKADFVLHRDRFGRVMLPDVNDFEMAMHLFTFLNRLDIPIKEKVEAIAINSEEDSDDLLIEMDLIDEENIEMAKARIAGILQLRFSFSVEEKAWIKRIVAPIQDNLLINELIDKLENS